MQSRILGESVEYCVYLPPDYSSSSRSYPVVYLLHGYSDDETGWVQFGEVNRIVDTGIASGTIAPMVIVMPDGGVSFYMDNHDGSVKWSSMFVSEFIPFIEKELRVRGTARFRAIAGLSMGGYGALINSLQHPDMFSACAAFSAAVSTDEEIMATPDDRYDNLFSGLIGPRDEGLPVHWHPNSVIHLAETLPEDQLKRTGYYIDCGDDDFLTIGNAELHTAFTKRGIPHQYRVRDGAHNWTYWRTGLMDGLHFISDYFRQK